MADFVQSLAIETWTLWSIGIILVACRMISRRMKFRSWARLQVDDWLMLVAAGTFTTDMFCLNEVAKNGSNYIEPEVAAALTPEQVDMAIYGSKMAFINEICALSTIWLVKICLLILYHRLTVAYEWQHRIVKIIGAFCVIAFSLVVILLVTLWCGPVEGYWAVPVQNSECATYYKHMIFATSFNITSDVMLLCIPIPIVVQSRIPLKRKVLLCCILIAILNRYYNFSNPNDLIYTYWYVAEVATAVYVGNIPLCWQFIAHVFRMGSWASFGSEQRQPEPVNQAPAGAAKQRKKLLHSMLPASLWSTQAGDTTRVTRRGDEGGMTRRMAKTVSEEAIVCDEAVDDRQNIELHDRLQNNPSWTTLEALPSHGHGHERGKE
ncbi:hypothetical protein OQA88_10249 [Cercophora sp. LCS_1]